MTHTERLRKLTNAINDYRGSYHPQTGKWIRGPQRGAIPRMCKWLQELDLDIPECLDRIDAFEFQDDMKKFLDEIAERKTKRKPILDHGDCDCSACCPN